MSSHTYPNSLHYNNIGNTEHYWSVFKRNTNETELYSDKLAALAETFDNISAQNCVLVLIWDAVKDRFVFAADKRNVVGHDVAMYLADEGIRFSFSNIHPDFFDASMSMQYKAISYILQHRNINPNKIVVNIDSKYKKGNGEYFHYLQQTVCIETNASGQPLLFLAYIHDITYLKKEDSANLIITTPDNIELWNYNFDKKELESTSILSTQEKKVLDYLRKGKNSKEIANELNISSHTVDTHRRNLLKKTNCVDTSGLVTYTKLVGLF